MDIEQPDRELVKCVVVGDTAVGKTRLICARACNSRLDLSQLMQTHIPTVWAIDQYRMHKEVLERSCEVVDGVNVSLRLWDTFGDHEKDRRFAYGRSDVVLLCFSIANPTSLRNCKLVWLPEIRKFCPNTPIVLVGCKNDLRYMYRDEQFLSLCRDRSPFYRPLRECDLLTPEQGRCVAREMNAPYFESSVLTHFGVGEVFENVIRVALTARRSQRFWITNLRNIKRPMVQRPFCPPKPSPPMVTIPKANFDKDIASLMTNSCMPDAAIKINGKVVLYVHRIVLASASSVFKKIFTLDSTLIETNVHQQQQQHQLHQQMVTKSNCCDQSIDECCKLCFQCCNGGNWQNSNTNNSCINRKINCNSANCYTNCTDDSHVCSQNYASMRSNNDSSILLRRRHSPTPLVTVVQCCKCNDRGCSSCCKCYVNEVTQVEDEIQHQIDQEKHQLHHMLFSDAIDKQNTTSKNQLQHETQVSQLLADESLAAIVTPSTGGRIIQSRAIESITSPLCIHEPPNVTSGICSSSSSPSPGDINVTPSISNLPSCNETALMHSPPSSITSEIPAIEATATSSSSSSSSSTPLSPLPPPPSGINTQGEIKFSPRIGGDGHPGGTQLLHPSPESELGENSFTRHPHPIDMETSIQVQVNNSPITGPTNDGQGDVTDDDTFTPFLLAPASCNTTNITNTSSDAGVTAPGGMSISNMDIDTIVEQTESGVTLTSITDSMVHLNDDTASRCKNDTKTFSSLVKPASLLASFSDADATATSSNYFTSARASLMPLNTFYKYPPPPPPPSTRYFNQPLLQLTRSASDSSISSSAEFLREKDALSFSSNGSTNNSSAYLIHSSDIQSSSQLANLSVDAAKKGKSLHWKQHFNHPNDESINEEHLSIKKASLTLDGLKSANTNSHSPSSASPLNDQSQQWQQITPNCDNRQGSSAVKLSTIKNVAAALISSAASSCIPRSATTIIKSSNNNGNQVNCCHCSGHKLKVTQVNKVTTSQYESTVYSNKDDRDATCDAPTDVDELNDSSSLLCSSKSSNEKCNNFNPNGNGYDSLGNNSQMNYEHQLHHHHHHQQQHHFEHPSSCQCICTSHCNNSNCGASSNRKFVHFGHRMRSNSWQTLPAFLKQSPSFVQMMEKLTSKIHQQQQLNQQQAQSSKCNGKSGGSTYSSGKSCLKSEKRPVDPFVWSLNHPIFDEISLQNSPIYADCYDHLNYSSTKCQLDSSSPFISGNNCNGDATDDEVYSSGSSDDLICTRKNCSNRSKAGVSCFGKKLAFNSNCTHHHHSSSSSSSSSSSWTNRLTVKSSESNFGYTDCQTFSHECHLMTILTVKSNCVSSESLEQVVNFIYTGTYPDLKVNSSLLLAKEVLYLADLLDIKQLSNSVKATYCQAKEILIANKNCKVLNQNNITASTSNSFSMANSYVNSPGVALNRSLIATDESGISSGYGSSDPINYDSSIKSFSQMEVSPLTSSDCLFEFCDTSKLDYLTCLKTNLANLSLNENLFHDVSFILDDGSLINCHRSILSARCEMMRAMFRGDFLESFSKLIKFPGVAKQTFNQLLYYFYTDAVKCDVKPVNCIKLLELANRLCLPNLVCLVEEKIIHDLAIMADESFDLAAETCLTLLEPCQIHNCDQLADYCLYYLSVNYKDVSQRQSKTLRSLHPENQAYLNRNRWPPIWFQKEEEYYDRCIREREWNEKAKGKGLKRHRINSVCLCFSTKSRKRNKERRKQL